MKTTKIISLRIDEDLLEFLNQAALQMYKPSRTTIIEGVLYEAVLGLSGKEIYAKACAGYRKKRESLAKSKPGL